MARPDNLARLHHMLDAAQKAVEFSRGKSLEEMRHDELLCLALVRLLEILGEAARGTAMSLQERYPEIPWREIISTRDRVAHGYLDIDMSIVYSIVAKDLPPLITHLERIVAQESG
ncbi:MAG: DUF86 domain-containing protein [Chloroflexi bacterium]|nr:DUF86 domain-containing protein [Chloroflexota bacterium]MBM3175351.1 DUF86 domain-containing protein [Chloroflexota bacterium]MBM4449525.1 DUF86 domain-containing protein [Chloroflexota bacterium]